VSTFRNRGLFPIVLLSTIIALTANLSFAGHYELIKKDDPQENYQFSDVDGVCTAYEENLKRFEHLPHGMACERQLDPKLGFSRPTWQKLDPMKYPDLVQDIFRRQNWDKNEPPNDKRPWIERLKERVEKNHLTMEITQADANRDGAPDNIIRIWSDTPDRACEPKRRLEGWMGDRKTIVVADPSLTKVADYFGGGSADDNVFFYKSRVYSDMFFGNTSTLRARQGRDATLYITFFTRHGAVTDGCKFHYHESSPANK